MPRSAARLFVLLLTAATLCAGVAGAAEPRSGLRAGAAAVDVTPPLGTPIVGNWDSRPAQRVHDPIMVRALVLADDGPESDGLKNDGTRLALVICDNVGIPREVFDAAKARLAAADFGLPPERVLCASTHTHTSVSARNGADKVAYDPDLNEYQTVLADGIVAAVAQSVDQLEPAEIAWGSVRAPDHLFNRRWFVSDESLLANPFGGVDQVRMNPPRGSGALVEQAGPVDPEVSFLSVRSRPSPQADGSPSRPIALLANYSLHYVGGVNEGDLSADYFGAFARRIAARLDAERLSPRFVGMLSNGTSGDVNAIDFTARKPDDPPYSAMERVADDLAAKIAAAHDGLAFHADPPLGSAQREIKLKIRKPTPEQLTHFDAVEAREAAGEEPAHRHERAYARRGRSLAKQADEVAILLQAHRIGDVGIATVPFETFTETGLELKETVPADTALTRAFTIELANGSYGYLPTPEQHALGGYETWLGTNSVEVNATRKIVSNLREMFVELAPPGAPTAAGPQ